MHNKYEAFDNLKQDIRCVVADFISGKPKDSLHDPNISSVFRTRALIKIQDGCNSFCSYCIVPHVGGREKSRPQTQIIEEINRLLILLASIEKSFQRSKPVIEKKGILGVIQV